MNRRLQLVLAIGALVARSAIGDGVPHEGGAAGASRELRKQFIIASALPPAQKGLRKEHVEFLRHVTSFLRQTNEADAVTRLTGFFYRGCMLLHCGLMANARADFDSGLALFPKLPEEAKLPVGVPGETAFKAYRAFASLDAGIDGFLEEIEKAEAGVELEGARDLGDILRRIGDQLAAREDYDQAIRVYQVLAKFRLWDPDKHQDPQKVVEILQMQKKNRLGGE